MEDEDDEVEVVLSLGLEEDGAAPADENDGPFSLPPPAADSPLTPCCLGTATPTAAPVLVAAMAAAERVRGPEGAATVVVAAVDCREKAAAVGMTSVISLLLS